MDVRGRPWTPHGDLRIMRLGVRVFSGVPDEAAARMGVSSCWAGDGLLVCESHSREPFHPGSGLPQRCVISARSSMPLRRPRLGWLPPGGYMWSGAHCSGLALLDPMQIDGGADGIVTGYRL